MAVLANFTNVIPDSSVPAQVLYTDMMINHKQVCIVNNSTTCTQVQFCRIDTVSAELSPERGISIKELYEWRT